MKTRKSPRFSNRSRIQNIHRLFGGHPIPKGSLGKAALLVPALLVTAFFAVAPALAVDGGNPNKPLNYGLHWFRMDPSAQSSDCGNQPGHDCVDAVLYDGTTRKWVENPAAQAPDSNLEKFYDPARPTIVYFHGWQPFANGKRESLKWEFKNETPVDMLEPWATAGWNVGIFYWDRFSDTEPGALTRFGVTGAQGKIWSSQGAGGIGYKYGTGYIYANFNGKPTSSDLGLPMFSSDHLVRWDNQTSVSRAISAMRFIQGVDPTDEEAGIEQLRSYFDSVSSCEEGVRSLTCDTGSSPLCSGNRLDWRDLFYTKVCQVPSVGDMAFENVSTALQDQTFPYVIFAGHSLGHQMATRTATHMWMAHIHGQSVGADSSLPGTVQNRDALPVRLALLDPYATNTVERALWPYTFDGNFPHFWSQFTSRRVTQRVANYVKRLKQITSTLSSGSFIMPTSYHHSTILAEVGGASWNPDLAKESAYQRHRFDYNSIAALGEKHNDSKNWYLSSYTEGALFPPLTEPVPAGLLPADAGLASGSWDAHIRDAMGTAPSGGVTFRQEGGRFTWDYKDDNFKPEYSLDDHTWPAGWGTVANHETAIARRLFNNQLILTADNQIDELYVNGESLTSRLTNASNWTQADTITNIDLHNGANVIAIKASDSGGIAAMIAELDLNGGFYATGSDWRVTHTTPPADWMEADFDDSSWDLATIHATYGDSPWFTNVSGMRNDTPAQWIWSSDANNHNTVYFRYVTPEAGPWKVRMANSNSAITDLTTAENVVAAAAQADLADGTDDGSFFADVLNFSDNGGNQGLFTDDQPYPNQPGDGNTFAILATGTVHVVDAGNYSFGFNVDDGARIKITKDGVETVIASLSGTQGPTTRIGQIYLDPGIYEIEVLAYENSGGAAFELFAANGYFTTFSTNWFELLMADHDLERIGEDLDETGLVTCTDDSAGIDVGTTGTSVTDQYIDYSLPSSARAEIFVPQMQTYNGVDTAFVKSSNTQSRALMLIEEEQSLDTEVGHAAENVGWIAIDSTLTDIRDAGNNLVGYAPSDELELTHNWTTVNLPHTFSNPVIIAGTNVNPGFFDYDPAHIRIRNVSGSSFQARVEEWAYQDGVRTLDMEYFVMEAGVHYMRSGQRIQVGKTNVNQSVKDVFTQINFPIPFTTTPVVFSMSQTFNGADPMVTRQRSVNANGFQVLVEEEELKDSTHATETIGWVAITGNTNREFGSCN